MANREPKDVIQDVDDQEPQQDPITSKSLSGPILVSSALLILSLFWALYDEVIGQRPWKDYQEQFIALYADFLGNRLRPQQDAKAQQVRATPEYQDIAEQLKAAEAAVAPRLKEIDDEMRSVRRQLAAISTPFQNARAQIAAITYKLDHSEADDKQGYREDIEEVRQALSSLTMPDENGVMREESFTFEQLEKRFDELKTREAQLNADRVEVSREATALRRKRDQYLNDHLDGPNRQQIQGLLNQIKSAKLEIRQIHVEASEIVDRCESCHLGTRQPVTLKAADMGGQRVFVSHPRKELLSIHDATRFGCTVCHNGNGRATSSVEKAHGNYEHWLWPMFPKENAEAGCLQCHFGDRVLDLAPTLTKGRDLFLLKGCAGCHRYEGYDRELDGLSDIRKQVQKLEGEKKQSELEAQRSVSAGDEAQSNQEAQQFYARAERLRVKASNHEAKIAELEQQAKYFLHDRKMIGPKLKDVRLKLRKEWIPVWLKDPQAFRPGTKMPSFRLSDEEIRALSAFIWQSALTEPQLPSQSPGDPARGRELFQTRGCLACHSIGEGTNRMGGTFAANLSRLGEKANYDYIVNWIHNPRERNPMAVMPRMRLSWDDSRDIASYLLSLKHEEATYPAAPFMDDPQLAQRGRQLVVRYGCASCHEISRMEDATRIGTELTKESSKPIEQLDFGLLEHQAKREGWYNHRGFYDRKLHQPNIYDRGREKAPEDKLRMPNLNLSEAEIRALMTFLLGSVDEPFRKEFRFIPEEFRYLPTDQQKDIQAGWWVIKKYNCMGCHVLEPNQQTALASLPQYRDQPEQLPPSLLQEGARVSPRWLEQFLTNPAMSQTETNRNGVRKYLKVRMPTFDLSPREVGILVRFFEARAGQQQPYVKPQIDPLSQRELVLARALFTSRAAPCLKCHEVGNAAHDRFATAPNFLLAKERLKPDWTGRWLINPQVISPGTAMPSGLFRRDGARWVFAGPTPAAFEGYSGDHVQLLVRYMFEITAAEQRRLVQTTPVAANADAAGRRLRLARAVVSH